MVAKKTAVQQSTTGRSTGSAGDFGAAAKGVGGKKSTARQPAKKSAGAQKSAVGTAPDTTAGATAGEASAKTAATKATPAKATPTKAVPTKTASATKKVTTKKATTKKVSAKRASTKTVATEKAAGGTTAEGSTAPVKRAPRKAAAKKSASARAAAAAPSKKAVRKSTGTAKKTVASAAEAAAQAAETTGATTVVAKKTPGTAAAADKPTAVPKARVAEAEPGELAVRPGEDPWTPEEVAEARAELLSEALRLRAEISHSEESLVGLMRDSGDGAGDDQADTGTKNITRESEMALAANAREMVEQTERALERLDAGTYGLCESCGNPIGKARMQAFPRATLCVECKQKQERRY
ncbi:TraR/DksA family transcriptional regulator [Streptomyces sp. CWNU-52B]|uniref:TraR/DksA family transcriptional regulator n=1 Tax=unclassified Streptomyces TaxID=2593676 RepID=UPI0039C152CF